MDRIRLAVAVAVAVLLSPTLAAAPAAAERLPLRSGDWIETRGPWRIEADRVVYRTPAGGLRSLPIVETALRPGRWPVPLPMRPRRKGIALREDPWGPIPEIPLPGPLPLPGPPLVRPRALPPLPVCILANARPGEPPELLCESRKDEN